jgi:hypothetical protein
MRLYNSGYVVRVGFSHFFAYKEIGTWLFPHLGEEV